jgi:hypothetical protein
MDNLHFWYGNEEKEHIQIILSKYIEYLQNKEILIVERNYYIFEEYSSESMVTFDKVQLNNKIIYLSTTWSNDGVPTNFQKIDEESFFLMQQKTNKRKISKLQKKEKKFAKNSIQINKNSKKKMDKDMKKLDDLILSNMYKQFNQLSIVELLMKKKELIEENKKLNEEKEKLIKFNKEKIKILDSIINTELSDDSSTSETTLELNTQTNFENNKF